ncbi:hypothetical protein [Cupriavidus sp. DL-D2]|uniref:hypothetical protein n=1 Tax=Cupriavidus sp. DL-D2 TaxID=3144974 RepID=UPI0032126E94
MTAPTPSNTETLRIGFIAAFANLLAQLHPSEYPEGWREWAEKLLDHLDPELETKDAIEAAMKVVDSLLEAPCKSET